MKKILAFSFLTILVTSALRAQINKGSVFLGGNVGFSTIKSKDTSLENNSVYITPVAGIAVKQNLIVGVSVNYSHSKNNLNVPASQTEYKSYGAGIFARKYVPLGKGFYLFGETGLNYQNYSDTYTYTSQKNELKVQSIGINLYPGVSYAVSKMLQLEVGLPQLVTFGYSKNEWLLNDATTQKSSGTNFNASASSFSSLFLGFRIFLPKG
jgi:autotransporter-like protein